MLGAVVFSVAPKALSSTNSPVDYKRLCRWIDHCACGSVIAPADFQIFCPSLGMFCWKTGVTKRFRDMYDDGTIWSDATSLDYQAFSSELFDGSKEVALMLREIASMLNTHSQYTNLKQIKEWTHSPYRDTFISEEEYSYYKGTVVNFFESIEQERRSGSIMAEPCADEVVPPEIAELCEDLYAAWGGERREAVPCWPAREPLRLPDSDKPVGGSKASCLLI